MKKSALEQKVGDETTNAEYYTLESKEWKHCTEWELKAFMVCSMYMGIKKVQIYEFIG